MAKRPMTLGELIATLSRKEEDAILRFDFVNFRPDGSILSYRGDYSQLALGYSTENDMMVGKLLPVLRDALGKVFTGYKGGEYLMGDETHVYVANSGESGSTAVVDVRDRGWMVTLETASFDD